MTAGKLKNQNNLLMKLAGSTWGQRQHSAVICSGALLFSSRVLRPSLVMLCPHKSGRCAVQLYHAPHVWYPPFYTWLRVPDRIEFKLSVLVFRCLHCTALPYLASKLRRVADVDTRKRLRSLSMSAIVTPSSYRTTIGDRAFFVAMPRAWNTLPSSVTVSETLGTFKRRLKTHLFATSFP